MKQQNLFSILFASLLLTIVLSFSAEAATWYVDGSVAGPGAGTRANPYKHIQSGIDRAAAGDTVLVANNTYAENIVLKNDVDLRGGGTIDGDGAGPAIYAHDITTRTVVQGFTLTNGYNVSGGGAYIDNSKLTFNFCTFIDNNAHNGAGGGLFIDNVSNVIFYQCDFTDNTAKSAGGAIAASGSSTIKLSICNFTNNNVNSFIAQGHFGPASGGAISITQYSTATIISCDFNGNHCTGDGGAISASMYSTLTLKKCELIDSWAKHDGGGVYIDGSDFYDLNNVYWKNEAISGGGGVHVIGGSFQLINSTVYGNIGGHDGDGLYAGADGTVTNCIFWAQTSEIYRELGHVVDVTNSAVQGGYPGGVAIIIADPMFRDSASGNFRLLSTSPCIDAGLAAPAMIADEDIYGGTRIVDGDDDGAAIIDIGADEYDPNYIPPVVLP